MDWHTRIISDPNVLVGKPTIKGTRISVELILGCFASDWSLDDILKSYPHITREDILAALAYAKHMASVSHRNEQASSEAFRTRAKICFVAEEMPEGGFVARAKGADIHTQAVDLSDLRAKVRDAVRCHFGDEQIPRTIHLRIIREEVLIS